MFRTIIILSLLLFLNSNIWAQVGINTDGSTPDESAMLDVNSTEKGMLTPRMSTSQRTAIGTPAQGLLVYDIDTSTFWYYDNGQWNEIKTNFAEVDGDITNEIQDLDLTDDILTITNNANATSIDLSPFSNDLITSSLLGNTSLPCSGDLLLDVVGDFNMSNNPTAPLRVGDNAFVLDQGADQLKVVDVSDSGNPLEIASLDIGGTPSDMVISGNYAYIVDMGSDDLKVVDISTPSSPSLAGSIALIGAVNPYSIAHNGNYVYIVDLTAGNFYIIDVSTPSSPTETATLAIGGSLRGVAVSGNYAYVINTVSDKIHVIDVNDASAPSVVALFSIGSDSRGIFIQGNYAYVIDSGSNDLKVIDLSVPTNLTTVGTVNISNTPTDVFVSGSYAYTVDANNNTMKVFDITDPTSPFLVNSISVGSFPTSLSASNNYVYVCSSASDDMRIVELACSSTLGFNSTSGEIIEVQNSQLSEEEVDAFVSNNGYLSTEVDGDITNEIQDLDLTNNTLTITNNTSASNIDLSSYLDADNLGSHTATQNIKLNGNWLSNDGGAEGIKITNTGNVGVNTSSPSTSHDFHVAGDTKLEGNLNYTDGSQANGYVLTSDANGNASWENQIPTVYYSEQESEVNYNNSDTYRDITNSVTVSFTGGDVFKIEANGVIRPTSGSVTDPFNMRVKVYYPLCGNTSYTKTVTFEPNYESNSHNLSRLYHYLDMYGIECGSSIYSNAVLTLQVRNTGDDAWSVANVTFVVTNLH